MRKNMEIKIAKKFTQKDIDIFIDKYFVACLETLDSEIVFNLEQLEWISAEEITFLFALMRKLILKEMNVIVKMPIISKKFEDDDDKAIERRTIANFHLYRDWKMFHTGVKDYNFINLISNINTLIDKKATSNKTNKILPFQIIPTERFSDEAVDSRFYQKSKDQFNIDNNIVDLLNSNKCYSPFENKVISEIITKELFMNSAEHANTDESYFTTALREKWENPKTPQFIDSFINEKEELTLDFFRDKEKIISIVKQDILKNKTKTLERINEEGGNGKLLVGLSKKDKNGNFYEPYNLFKNQSYLEFTFVDFGCGIYETLEAEYNRKKEYAISRLSTDVLKKHIHSQVLEYAFLLDSSKDPFDNRIERADLIPRGLYFLIDMVRRYKGLLVARSGNGKVVYDFSDRIYIVNKNDELFVNKDRIYVAKDAVVNSDNSEFSFFAGTMISIILPEREKGKFRKSGVRIDDYKLNYNIFNQEKFDIYPKEQFAPKFYEYLHLSFSIYVSETNDEIHGYDSKFSTDKGKVNLVFIQINNKLKILNENSENCVLFIDFEYLPKINLLYKIYTYLQNSPLINERIKVIAINVDDNELNALKEYEYENNIKSQTSFLFKAIPCVRLSKLSEQNIDRNNIQWIGVDDKEDDILLTELLFNSDKSLDKSLFRNEYLCEGNVISKYQDRAISIFSNFNDLIRKARIARENIILEWVKNDIMKDGEKPTKKHNEKRLFLTSKGTFQTKYLSFYDTLNFKYSAKFFARFLLDKYIDSFNVHKELIKFDQILAVTVSSQLLAIEIRNLIKEDDSYSFLRINNSAEIDITDCPSLIKLSSYFSFEEEKPFKDIKEGQRILIVNDVISTGSLIERLIKGIEKKDAKITSVLAIADTRKRDVDKSIEYPSIFFDEIGRIDIENKIISIISSEQNPYFIIEKFKYKPQGAEKYKIKRINPILNSIVTLNSKHTEKNKILFENSKGFFDTVNPDIFQIGHFKQSLLSCSSYFTDMYALLRNGDGIKLLELCKDEIVNKTGEQYSPFFIFHPVHSGIEQISEETYNKIFGTNKANIVGLQRYQTPLGWRFIFPPKRFNDILKGQPILITDSGTLSGQSLIQLIDAVSIYEVSRIDVLIIIGRLDDFQREFYSRLQTIKVKTKIDNNKIDKNKEVIVPLNIFFGTNLHIPSYQTEDMCPFCKELFKLNEYKHKDFITKEVKNYIEKREEEIKTQKNGEKHTPKYIPTDRTTEVPDFKNIFLMRDELGKIDGYRFYEDYFSRNDDSEEERLDDLSNRYPNEEWTNLFYLRNKEDLKKFEQVLICILHEPNLVATIKDLLLNLFVILKNIIYKLINNYNSVSELNYNWSYYALLRVYHILCDKNDFFSISNFELVFSFCEKDDNALNYFSFVIWESYYFNDDLKEYIRNILIAMNDKFDNIEESNGIYCNDKNRNIIKSIVRRFELNPPQNINDAFYNLKKFFIKESSADSHSDLKRQIFQLISGVEDREITSDRINHLIELCSNISRKLNHLGTNLATIKDSISKGDKLKYDYLFIEDNSIYKRLSKIDNDCSLIKDSKRRIIETNDIAIIQSFANEIDTFQTEFLLEDKNFVKFCKRYIVDLNHSISSAKKTAESRYKHKKGQTINLIINNIATDNIFVNMHGDLLEYAIEEIFYNAAKYRNDIDTIISCNVNQLNNIIELTISQNKGFIDSDRVEGHGIDNIIKPVFETFCGINGVLIDTLNENEYNIKIKFNKYQLQDN